MDYQESEENRLNCDYEYIIHWDGPDIPGLIEAVSSWLTEDKKDNKTDEDKAGKFNITDVSTASAGELHSTFITCVPLEEHLKNHSSLRVRGEIKNGVTKTLQDCYNEWFDKKDTKRQDVGIVTVRLVLIKPYERIYIEMIVNDEPGFIAKYTSEKRKFTPKDESLLVRYNLPSEYNLEGMLVQQWLEPEETENDECSLSECPLEEIQNKLLITLSPQFSSQEEFIFLDKFENNQLQLEPESLCEVAGNSRFCRAMPNLLQLELESTCEGVRKFLKQLVKLENPEFGKYKAQLTSAFMLLRGKRKFYRVDLSKDDVLDITMSMPVPQKPATPNQLISDLPKSNAEK